MFNVDSSVPERQPQAAFVVTMSGDNGAPKGWVVVDTLVDGWAMGGVRMTTAVTEDEVRGLARGMTEKLTLVGLPVGGAKGGIVVDPGEDKTDTLKKFGRTAAPLMHGGVHLGADLGVGPAERRVFFEAAGYDPRKRPRAVPMPYDWRTYYEPLVDVTGHGTGVAAVTALETLQRNVPGRVVIQGFGSVGRAVARFLVDRGHQIVGVADEHGTISGDQLSIEALIAITDPLGRIDRSRLPRQVTVSAEPDAWLDVPADVLILAAQKDALNAENVHRLRAELVVEGGNLCASTEAKLKAAAAGGTLIPDVVANVGGAAAAALALTGTVPFELPDAQRKDWVFDWVGTRVRDNTRDLLSIAAATPGDPLPALLSARLGDRR